MQDSLCTWHPFFSTSSRSGTILKDRWLEGKQSRCQVYALKVQSNFNCSCYVCFGNLTCWCTVECPSTPFEYNYVCSLFGRHWHMDMAQLLFKCFVLEAETSMPNWTIILGYFWKTWLWIYILLNQFQFYTSRIPFLSILYVAKWSVLNQTHPCTRYCSGIFTINVEASTRFNKLTLSFVRWSVDCAFVLFVCGFV